MCVCACVCICVRACVPASEDPAEMPAAMALNETITVQKWRAEAAWQQVLQPSTVRSGN